MREQASSLNWLHQLISGIGQISLGLLLIVIVIQFFIVLFRHVFGLNFIWAQEIIVYAHASTILLALAWTLLVNRHVRIDVISERWTPGFRKRIDRFGIVVILVPGLLVVLWSSIPYVGNSWSIFEGSREISGLPGLFLIKSLLLYAALSLLGVGLLKLSSAKSENLN